MGLQAGSLQGCKRAAGILKAKLQDYDQQGTSEKWELFKVEFNNDMDDLGKSISNMAARNMKK